MDIKVNKPAPIELGKEVEVFKRGVNVKQTIEALEAGKSFVIKEFYNNGLKLLDELQKHLDKKYSDESFKDQRAADLEYHKLSNLLLMEVIDHKLPATMAPNIGWFKLFYPENKNKNMSDDECETTPANAKWKRVMLKISGEALSGNTSKDGQNFGLDPRVVERIAGEIVAASMSGVEIAVVVGGGNFFRGASHEGAHLDRASADYMGMLATVMNAISLQGAIEAKGVQTRVLSALSIKEVAEPYIRRRAMRHLEKGRVVIFGAGTGNPFFTTDTGAALRAAEINAQVVLKATKVDGVFCSDPKQNVNAKKYERLSYETVQRLGLGVMDQTAITMCRENDLPIVVFDMTKGGNIHKAIRGQAGVGTCISDSDEKCP